MGGINPGSWRWCLVRGLCVVGGKCQRGGFGLILFKRPRDITGN
jgi:hypothetical protein